MSKPEVPPDSMPEQEPWDCAVDGHEFEEEGCYDPDTNCYPYMQCKYCPQQREWEPPDDPEWP